jgi:hypothetical protein
LTVLTIYGHCENDFNSYKVHRGSERPRPGVEGISQVISRHKRNAYSFMSSAEVLDLNRPPPGFEGVFQGKSRQRRNTGSLMTSAEAQEVVDIHNYFRKQEGASDMEYMVQF